MKKPKAVIEAEAMASAKKAELDAAKEAVSRLEKEWSAALAAVRNAQAAADAALPQCRHVRVRDGLTPPRNTMSNTPVCDAVRHYLHTFGPSSIADIAAGTGVAPRYVSELLCRWRNAEPKKAYVHGWERSALTSQPLPLIALGDEDDAPKPPRISRRETNRRYYVSRRRRMDRQAGAGACLQSVWQALRNDAAP